MNPTSGNSGWPVSTRRWPRYQVKLPVSISSGEAGSAIAGLVTEISQRGMAVYGGVRLKPGDKMEVEFPTSSHLKITGIVRNRSGYCFGLEFLTLLDEELAAPARAPRRRVKLPLVGSGQNSVVPAEENLVALVQYRHQAYLKDKEQEIERLRQKAFKVRQMRRELELLFPTPASAAQK